MNSPIVQKSTVAAPKIDQPKFADILQMNKRVPARNFRRFQHDRVSGGSSQRTTSFDRIPSPIACFQQGIFFWGHAHAEALSKLTAEAKYLSSAPDLEVDR